MTPKAELVSVASSLPEMTPEEMVETIKQTVAKGATDAELNMFLAVARKFDLDPFAREIFFIKDKDKPNEAGRVQTGRDGFLAIANRHPSYQGMTSDVIYAGDTFQRTETGVEHRYDVANRKGTIIGSYAIVYRSDRRIPSYAFARFSEYCPSNPRAWSPWHNTPSAMILKVSESNALKKAFSISGISPIGIGEPDDDVDYVDTAPVAPARAQIPFAQAVGRYAPDDDLDGPTGPVESPRPVGGLPDDDESPSSSALGGEHVLSAEELEAMGQTRLDDDEIPQ